MFLSELRSNVGSLAGVVNNDLLRVAFVSGLALAVSSQLRALPQIEKIALTQLVEVARAFCV